MEPLVYHQADLPFCFHSSSSSSVFSSSDDYPDLPDLLHTLLLAGNGGVDDCKLEKLEIQLRKEDMVEQNEAVLEDVGNEHRGVT